MGLARILAFFVGIDLVFKLLVGATFLEITCVHGGPSRGELLAGSLQVVAVSWPLWLALLWLVLRPGVDWARRRHAKQHDVVAVVRAHAHCMKLPARVAALWTAHWVASYFVILGLGGYHFGAPQLLFLITLITGPAVLGHALAEIMTMDTRRELGQLADNHRVRLDFAPLSIRQQISFYAICIALAPAGFMASIGVASRAGTTGIERLYYAVAIGMIAVVAFALIVAFLVAAALARPLAAIDDAIQRIAQPEGPQEFARVPRLHGNEIGALADHTNELLARLEREARQRATIDRELAIAQQIQTSILPRRWDVDGLEISASMVTATKVGGDYYDILPRTGGGWIGIGDVSGHGVSAGLIMLMLQSVTATMVSANPNASTREIVVAINRVLADNIRKRMRGNDFITFTLLRYDVDGRLRFAGAHEDLVVWRAREGRCERVPTPGPWVGVRRDIDAVTVESELVLQPDDVLVLYTDGVTEARNHEGTQFGMERLCATVEAHAKEGPDAIVGNLVEAVRRWGRAQEDDISVVAARHVGLN